MSEKTFTLSLDVNVTLSVSELWPDGDAPENPTAEDVENLIRDDGGWARILDDWNLIEPHMSGTVTDNAELAAKVTNARTLLAGASTGRAKP